MGDQQGEELHSEESTPAHEETEMLMKLNSKDPEALAALYDRFGRVVFSLAGKMLSDSREAEEVTQDVFVSIWKNSSKYAAERSSPLTWIATITRNKCIDRLRKAGRRIPGAHSNEEFEVPVIDDRAASNPFLMVALSDLSSQVNECLGHLSTPQRDAVDSAYFECLTMKEIAERNSIPQGTVKSRLRLAMDKLRRCLRQLKGMA